MKPITCPKCHQGTVEQVTIPRYRTKIGGADFTVRDATIAKCTNGTCDFISVAATELKRWEEQQKSTFQERGLLPTPERIEAVLGHFRLTRADLANLLGVTRQTIQGWMKDPSLIPEGPGPILIQLLEAEAQNRASGVYDKLTADARERGHIFSATAKPKGISSSLQKTVPQKGKFFCPPEPKTAA